MRRTTVKEVKLWMKTLEENRYKKTYNSDCRRVAWMVNNEGVELSQMPVSMAKKWTKAQYGRERYLAKEYIRHLKSKVNETVKLTRGKLSELIKEVITELGNTRLSTMKDIDIHSRDMARLQGKKHSIGIDKKTMKKLVTLIRSNMGLFEGNLQEGQRFRLPNGLKVEFLGKMAIKLSDRRGTVRLDVNEIRQMLKAAKRHWGLRGN